MSLQRTVKRQQTVMGLKITLSTLLFMLVTFALGVTQVDLHRHFHALGAGVIEEVRVQHDKGFGFLRYSTHAEAALAIQLGNSHSLLCGKQIKCSWGSKATPPGMSSNPIPPSMVAAPMAGPAATDLLAYNWQLSMSTMCGSCALVHSQGQPSLKQAVVGLGAACWYKPSSV